MGGGTNGIKSSTTTTTQVPLEQKHPERDKQMRLDRTADGTRITLNNFSNFGERIESAPNGKGKDSVKEQRNIVYEFLSKFGKKLPSFKSFVGFVSGIIGFKGDGAKTGKTDAKAQISPEQIIAEERFETAKNEFKAMTKGKESVPSKMVGLLFGLAESSKSDENLKTALKFAVADGVAQYKANAKKVDETGFSITLSGGVAKTQAYQLTDEGQLKLREFAVEMKKNANPQEVKYLDQFLSLPLISVSTKEILTNQINGKPGTFYRGNTFASFELSVMACKGIHVDVKSVGASLLGTQTATKLVENMNSWKNEHETLDKKIKEDQSKNIPVSNEDLKRREVLGELITKTRPTDREVANVVVSLAEKLIHDLLGTSESSARSHVTDTFKNELISLSNEIASSVNVDKKDREVMIFKLYQNAFCLRSLSAQVTNLTMDPSLSFGEKRVIMMTAQVFQAVANDSILDEKTSTPILMETAVELPEVFKSTLRGLMDSLGAPKVE